MVVNVPEQFQPPGYGQTVTTEAAHPRKLNHEENINRQVQLCLYLRSVGADYTEAVLSLRDCCIGLEDEKFNKDWAEWPCHAKEVDGRIVFTPTPADAAVAFGLIMSLLSRWGMTFQKRTVSKTPTLPPVALRPDFQVVMDEAAEAGTEP